MTPDKMPKKKGHRAKGYKKMPIIVTTDGGDLAEPSLVMGTSSVSALSHYKDQLGLPAFDHKKDVYLDIILIIVRN